MVRDLDANTAPAVLTVSVRALCAFAARSGDLDLRFTPAPTALEGSAGHRLVQARRDGDFEAELALSCSRHGLRVRGRADGYDATRSRLEEIKTFRGKFDAIKGNQRALHWAQAKVYAAMVCARDRLDSIEVVLVYLDLATQAETLLEAHFTQSELDAHLDDLCQRYRAWALHEAAHRDALDACLTSLAFPQPAFRAGQRELAQRIYQAAVARRCLLAQAPTGIGKTLASLFPLLKAMKSTAARPAERIDKIFFLTAKTPGRVVALDALRQLRPYGAPLRVLEIVARESACVHPGSACHGEACPLARGFYDRLPAARQAAATHGWLDRDGLRQIALAHQVCPYFLAQEMVRWSDVVVADVNYWFDTSAFLYAMSAEEGWQTALLVDEAHNLPDRARGMYSAQLDGAALQAALGLAPPTVRRALQALLRQWQHWADAPAPGISDAVPTELGRAVQEAVGAMADHFAAQPQAAAPDRLQRCFFDLLHFARLAESFGDHSVVERGTDPDGGERLAIRNLIPAPFLRPRFAATRSAACFSGTLAPFDFYRDMLGLPADTATLDVASPFHADQLSVRLAVEISTRWRDRPHSLVPLLDIVADQYAQQPGNYLAFFGSFDYLDVAADAFALAHPHVPTWRQSRGMSPAARDGFLAQFGAGGRGIGFAVLGGAFGEGIDLPGDRLVGAFIASLGLPQHDALNEAMRERMQVRFGEGYAYTYLYPGLQKVVQAAGRVIRSERDRGVVYLLDDRFTTEQVRSLLPRWWRAVGWRAGDQPALTAESAATRRLYSATSSPATSTGLWRSATKSRSPTQIP